MEIRFKSFDNGYFKLNYLSLRLGVYHQEMSVLQMLRTFADKSRVNLYHV